MRRPGAPEPVPAMLRYARSPVCVRWPLLRQSPVCPKAAVKQNSGIKKNSQNPPGPSEGSKLLMQPPLEHAILIGRSHCVHGIDSALCEGE